ncbi:hypothetical protein JHN63_42790 [Streptomyces sp. MBT65]|uniref:hypothetical protein n=1 Tax=Streptomyces sp. MBT65 TaxID=1488395 RepID=UPI00190D1000|nr:hypothetical protein [Streptomyces sp. MBT65]MBK3580403.1 hypothetical protein [Streptomyces sp. MBT65]
MFTFLVLALVLVATAVILAVLGIHALLLGRVPGRWLQRRVRQPRLWGAGVLVMLASLNRQSVSLLAIGIGLVALGHVAKPMR